MEIKENQHRLILKIGAAFGFGLVAISVYGLLGGTLEGSFYHSMVPIGIALGAFNLVVCISGLRK